MSNILEQQRKIMKGAKSQKVMTKLVYFFTYEGEAEHEVENLVLVMMEILPSLRKKSSPLLAWLRSFTLLEHWLSNLAS